MIHDLVQGAIGLLILLAAALKLWQLRRADPGTGRLAVGVMCGAVAAMGVAALQETNAGSALLEDTLGAPFAYAMRHSFPMISVTCLPVAFLCWTRPAGPERRRRVGAIAALLGAVLLVRWVLASLGTPAGTAAALTGRFADAGWTGVAAVLWIAWAAVTIGSATVMAFGWARTLRATRPSTALGLRILVVSGCAFGAYLVHKIVFIVLVLAGGTTPYDLDDVQWPLLLVAELTLAAGICAPLLGRVARGAAGHWRQQRAHRRLRPLWAALTRRHPGVIMPLTPAWLPARLTGTWDALDPREVELRLFRRTIECWDVLTGLAGHLDVRVRDEALAAARAAGLGERAPAVATAVMIRRGLGRLEDGAEPVEERHRADPPLRDGELAANVAWWQQVSAEWDDPLTVRLAGTASAAPMLR